MFDIRIFSLPEALVRCDDKLTMIQNEALEWMQTTAIIAHLLYPKETIGLYYWKYKN